MSDVAAGDLRYTFGTFPVIWGMPDKKFVIEHHKLKGAVLFGDTANGLWYLDLIRSGADVSHLRDVLAFGPELALPQAA